MKLLAGTSGYSFKEWKGSFYPADLKSDQLLSFYATKFPTLEINNTFYRLPKEHVLLEWASQVPEQFTFSLKASQRITHFTRLKAESESLVGFLMKNTSVLGDRLGPILFQLPPNLPKDVERLKNFLGFLPIDRRYAFEFRHESWFDEETFAVLRDRDIALCVAESGELACPVVSTATWGYLRLHKLDYSATDLETWAKCVASQSWNEAYVYFKHDEGAGSGPPAVEAFVSAARIWDCVPQGS
ncbi:MAG TPA: DUF72 domain-containing protein [Gemmatimonadaceae bacterium]|nr:DUF72 domain-containing protein [Gemmatimonadaceae bacterium]